MTERTDNVRGPDRMPELDRCVAYNKPNPDIPWPDDWEVCGVPDFEPLSMSDEYPLYSLR